MIRNPWTMILFGWAVLSAGLSRGETPGPASPGVMAGPFVRSKTGHAYYLLESSNWSAAQASARLLGGNLVTINDDDECDWVFDMFSFFGGRARALWCGLNDADQEGIFRWISGEVTDFENWAAGEPNPNPDFAAVENHVFLYPTANPRTRRWRDASNDAVESYLPSALWATVEDTVFDCQGLVEIVPAQPHPSSPRITVGSDRISIAWEVRVGSGYQLQEADGPYGPWRNLGTRVVGTPALSGLQVRELSKPGEKDGAFYRVVQVL